ncbi:hypothetical protein [Aminipila sp.]|uniref:hypothetical protein n=1 Tax=Aminipila sp. TaxID=2060095 RepID=UPI00289DE306|nr:hypothetical protein [Aminipila sp.]
MGNFLSKYTGQQIETMLEQNMANPPYIGENGNWYVYNKEEGDYIDSGISATGPEGAKGDNGEQGPPGPAGPKGDDGRGLNILGIYPTLLDLQTAHAIGNIGDAYAVGSETDNVIYIWDADLLQWVNLGALQGPQGPAGADGKTAYQSAVDGGYTGTEAEFNTILATAQSQIGNLSDLPTTEKSNLVGAVSELNASLTTHKSETQAHTELSNRTIYVSVTSGNDTSGTGASTTPYKTITKALSTIKKNINYCDIKIRILAGDYRAEGTIWLKEFRGRSLTLTAFDGTNDIVAVNDNYIIEQISMYNCDEVYIWGLKGINPTTSTYGIFISNCRYVWIKGYKNNDSAVVNSGIGVTEGTSMVLLENCLCANKSAVISSNYGSKVVSKDWDSASINNTYGLITNYGAQIHEYNDAQPTATTPIQMQNGGVVFDKNGNPYPTSNTYQTLVSRDMTITGSFDVAITLSQPPKWIQFIATVQGTKYLSNGQYSGTNRACTFVNLSGNSGVSYDAVQINDGANAVIYNVSEVTKGKITLARTTVGSGITGTMYLSVLCGF